MEAIHKSVLLDECLKFLSVEENFPKNPLMIDSTLGEGGHSEAFLKTFPSIKLIGIDADSIIMSRAKERLADFLPRVKFYNGYFDEFYEEFSKGSRKADIILFDLGLSMFHYKMSARGFSFIKDERLDMRLNEKAGESARDIVNTMREEELANLIFSYGEERYSRSISRAIVERRTKSAIESTRELADIVYNAVPSFYRHGKIHPATRTFQALRIAVNDELSRLTRALHAAFNALNYGGKMGVITFHSLEDRIVKRYFSALKKSCVCAPNIPNCVCGGKPCAKVYAFISPSAEEVAENAASRSAKLRVVKKIRDAEKERMESV